MFPFLTLPAELRIEIYTAIALHAPSTAIRLTCRQIKHEHDAEALRVSKPTLRKIRKALYPVLGFRIHTPETFTNLSTLVVSVPLVPHAPTPREFRNLVECLMTTPLRHLRTLFIDFTSLTDLARAERCTADAQGIADLCAEMHSGFQRYGGITRVAVKMPARLSIKALVDDDALESVWAERNEGMRVMTV
jgi:hypothetical protein